MYNLLLVAHVLICILVIILVLVQHGKGAEMGAALTGASQTVFGSQGSLPFLTKLVAICATLFFLSSFNLDHFVARRAKGSATPIMHQVAAKHTPKPVNVSPKTAN